MRSTEIKSHSQQCDTPLFLLALFAVEHLSQCQNAFAREAPAGLKTTAPRTDASVQPWTDASIQHCTSTEILGGTRGLSNKSTTQNLSGMSGGIQK